MVPLTGQNTINDMVDRINEVGQEIENVALSNANAVSGPASSVPDQLMAFSDATGKLAKAANISAFVYSILDDSDAAEVRATLGLKSSAVLNAATAATANTVVQRDANGNIAGASITAASGFVGDGSQLTSLDVDNVGSGTLTVANGGTGTTTATGTGSVVKNTSPTLAGTPLSTTAPADTNTTQIATTAFVIGQASSTSPVMNGSATVGASLRYARADHVHPSDTSKVNTSLLGVANGVATLDSGGKVPTSQLPAYVDDVLEYANLASFPATGESGKIYVARDTNKTYRWSGSAYIYITSGAVDSVAGKTGAVTLVKGDVGLGNVDNTSDATKSIGGNSATATKLQTARTINGVPFDGTANITVADSTKMPLAGGVFTGLVHTSDAVINSNSAGGSSAFQVTGSASSGAVFSLHRAGAYGLNIGLDTDNVFRIGGWSDGATHRMHLDPAGNFTARGNITAYSDIRLKTDIQVIPNALAKVCALRGVTYERTDSGERQTGLIAQEVQAVLPEAVNGDEYLGVAYGNLVGLLVEAIKELSARVEELENGAS